MARITFPWLRPLWLTLSQAIEQDTLAHGMGIESAPDRGSDHLIEQMVRLLLCQAPVSNEAVPRACGVCKQCLLLKAGTHPDLAQISPEGDKQLGVDLIRSLSQLVQQRTAQGGRKVIVIRDAERMTSAAANSLLKTLEEPPEDTFIIVSSRKFSLLLPTIRSRLMMITVPRPSRAEILHWFETYGEGKTVIEAEITEAIEYPLRLLRRKQSGTEVNFALPALLRGEFPLVNTNEETLDYIDAILRELHGLHSLIGSNDTENSPVMFNNTDSVAFQRHLDACYQEGIRVKKDLFVPGMTASTMLRHWMASCTARLEPFLVKPL